MANRTSFLQQWLESIWYGKPSMGSSIIAKCFLHPLSIVYSCINTYQRNTQTKTLSQLSCPVIVVGNITVGGTGKTPLTIYLVKLLQSKGYKPAIITRGYGGKATTWPQSVLANSDASLVGDEAVLMAQRTGVPVYAGANRLSSIEQLLKQHDCDVIVSDDGMQHYKLPRDIQIAVIDAQRQLGNGSCLPAGPLREKKERLNTCDFIVFNGKASQAPPHFRAKSGEVLSNHDISNGDINTNTNTNEVISEVTNELSTDKHIQHYEMILSGINVINLLTNEAKPLSYFATEEVQAMTGIGNPQRFYSSLKAYGLNVIEHSFPDHHDFIANDLLFDVGGKSDENLIVMMTEKDAVKCRSLIADSKDYWYLPVDANLSEGFEEKILDKLRPLHERNNG